MVNLMEEACRIIIEDIINGKITTRRELEVEKRQLCRDRNLKKFMSNSVILEHASLEEKKIVSNLLRKKPTRTISGVAIVAVMCHPHQCPHGRCYYCPESDIAPPSYTGEEPAALRGRMFKFHPYVQCYNRLKQLHKVGHPIDKVELIIMGGTFPSKDICYQEWFVSQCLKAMSDFGVILENITEIGDIESFNKEDLLEYPPYSNNALKTYPPNDYVLIDCPAGIEQGFENCVVGADRAIVVVNPELTSVRDADRVIGKLDAKGLEDHGVIVNRLNYDMTKSGDMLDVSDITETLSVKLLGVVPQDTNVTVSTNKGEPIVLDEKAFAGKAFRNIAERIIGKDVPFMDLSTNQGGLLKSLKKIFGRK